MNIEAMSVAGVLASAFAALAYGLYFRAKPPSLLAALVKSAFMGGLVLALFDAPAPLILALILAALGDFFLALDDKPWALPLGMLAFLGMQLLYILMFFGVWMLSDDSAPEWPRYALMAAILAVVAGFLIWFWREPRQGNGALAALAVIGALTLGAAPLVLAGVGYVASFDDVADWNTLELAGFWGALALGIVFMALRRDLGLIKLAGMAYGAVAVQMALMSFWLPWVAWPAMLGAILFVVSDGVLSTELFRMAPQAPARRWTGPVVWWSYVAAQALIVIGLLLGRNAMQ